MYVHILPEQSFTNNFYAPTSLLPRRSTLIGCEQKLNDSGLFTFLVNAINV